MKAKRQINRVLDYLSVGLDLKHLDIELSLNEFVEALYPKEYSLLSQHLNAYDILLYLNEYSTIKEGLLKQVLKEGLYSLSLLIISYLLSWFFLVKFSVSVYDMISSFDLDLGIISRYQTLVQIYLFFVHILVLTLMIALILMRSKAFKILFYIHGHKRIHLLETFITFRYAMIMSLFLKYGIKTQVMVSVMRQSSIDPFSRWLSYHVEDDLLSGHSFNKSLKQSFFDMPFVLLVEQGLLRNTFEKNLLKYIDFAKESLSHDISKLLKIFKTCVFLYLLILMAMFYSVLYLPMQIMEVL